VKVIIDENLPPALAKALDALFAGEHEVVHLRAKFGPSVSDVEWISQLSAEGRWVVISGDARITRNRAERAAFRKSKTTKQMQRLLERWDDIEATVGLIAGGAMYELPIKGKIRQLKTS
jgi:hypothetical protein